MKLHDDPIRRAIDDLLDREEFASHIAEDIEQLSTSRGNVVSVSGPWGSGKTSLIELMVEKLKTTSRTSVIRFNPWLFSEAEELVVRFFSELAAQMRSDDPTLRGVSRKLFNYGQALAPLGDAPVLGGQIKALSGALTAAERMRQLSQGSLYDQQESIRAQLETLDTPIVVVLDDIDRLVESEIREVFKLVRLTANFPRLVFVLALDEDQAATALGTSGEEYIKKIIQTSYHVPTIPLSKKRSVLVKILEERVFSQLTSLKAHNNPRRTGEVVDLVILPMMETIRDIKRFCMAAESVMPRLIGFVDLADLLGLVALQTSAPKQLRYLALHRGEVTRTTSRRALFSRESTEAYEKKIIEQLHCQLEERAGIGDDFLRLHFPEAANLFGLTSKWREEYSGYLRQRRIAHLDVLSTFFDRNEGPGLSVIVLAEEVFSLFADQTALYELMHSDLSADPESVLVELSAFEGDFKEHMVVPAATALLDSLDLLPDDRNRTIFAPSTQSALLRIVKSLLKVHKHHNRQEIHISEIYNSVKTLSGKLALLKIIGPDPNEGGEDLVSAEFHSQLASELLKAITESPDEELVKEVNFLKLLFWAKSEDASFQPSINSIVAPLLLQASLETERELGGEITEQKFNPTGLNWLFGDESKTRDLIKMAMGIPDLSSDEKRIAQMGSDYFANASD